MKISLQNASLHFQKTLFENLSLDFSGPGIIGFLGPSGCGKSTLIRVLAGLQKLDQGKVRADETLRSPSFVFQDSQLLGWRNVFENVGLPLELKGPINSDKVRKTLKIVGLQDSEKLFPSELSGGMKMRTSLARAFVTESPLLFCDEPFSALDEITREKLQEFLYQYVQEKRALCFFVTHSIEEALLLSHEIYYFTGTGKITAQNKISVLRSNQTLSEFKNSHGFQEQLQNLKVKVKGAF